MEFLQEITVYKSVAKSFDGAPYYSLSAVFLNQCVNSCVSPVSEGFYCQHAGGQTAHEMTGVLHVSQESEIMSDYFLHVSVSGGGGSRHPEMMLPFGSGLITSVWLLRDNSKQTTAVGRRYENSLTLSSRVQRDEV